MPNKRLRIGVSMREVNAQGYDEPRDALARNWGDFLQIALPEAVWLPVPNLGAEWVKNFCTEWDLNGLILTGGEDVGISPMRDETERALLRFCVQHDQPVLAVCRGLQLIWLDMGGELETREGHRSVRHTIKYLDDHATLTESGRHEVNSFHNSCLRMPSAPMRESSTAFAQAEDGTIEGVRFRQGRVIGVMWHPEREPVPNPNDVALVRRLFGLEK